jgi:virulence-associated protein VapD
MQLRRAAVGVALVAMVVVAGCDRAGEDSAGGGGEDLVAPAADQAANGAPGRAEGGAADQAAPAGGSTEAGKAGSAGSTEAAAQVRLVDLGNRVVRTALVDLQVDEGDLNKTINDATDIVLKARGLYVGSSTSVPEGEPASGQVTFRVPVDAFEPVLRQLKELGTYRGEKSSTEDVTNQYVDLNAQLAAWRAQERVYLRLLDRAKSVADVIAVQNQLQQVQSNIERLQGQLNHLEDQSSFSTIVLQLSEPGAGGQAAQPTGRLARAWATAVNGLGVMAAAVLVAVVWLAPVVVLAGLVLLGVRALRRPRPVSG